MVTSPPQRQRRLVSLSIYCTATLILHTSSVDAFSLVQNAAADPSSSPAAGGAPTRRGRLAAAAIASSASAANPFRGSLNSRRQRNQQPSSSDDFALRMVMQSDNEHVDNNDSHDNEDGSLADSSSSQFDNKSQSSSMADEEQQIYERRAFLSGMLATTASVIAASTAVSSTVEPALAYEESYPLELISVPADVEMENSSNSLTKLQKERISYKKAKVDATKTEFQNDPLGLNQNPLSTNFGLTIAGASTWALALWFATGSRSNPIVTPLANVLYDDKSEDWLADRNDGYFGDLPPSFMAILSAVFVFMGVLFDRAIYFAADGDAAVSLQLAGVSVIGGAVWEVGRLAAKEKAPTRKEYERDVLLYQEFEEFANKRIIVGKGSCHRSEVIAAFRRYNPKYRQADNEQYPLVDIEIERILRQWNREFGSGNEMSSAGFFGGIVVEDVMKSLL